MYEARQNKEKVSRRIAKNKVVQKQAKIQLNYGEAIVGESGAKACFYVKPAFLLRKSLVGSR